MRSKIKEMYWFFSILCFLFLAFNLEVVPGRPWHNRYALIWKWHRFVLIRLFPIDVLVLVDKNVVYRYMDASTDTYVPAVRMDTHTVTSVLNHRYLLDWIVDPPTVKPYPSTLTNEVEILNYLSQSLTP